MSWTSSGGTFRKLLEAMERSWAARPAYRILLFGIICVAVSSAFLFSFETWLDKRTIGWGPTALLLLWTAIGTVTGAAVHVVYSTIVQWTPWRESSQPDTPARESHEFASQFFGVVGVIYAVLVAFVVVTAWQARTDADDLTIQEQHNVDYLFHLNEAYPSETARAVRYLLRDYAVYTLAEWAQMTREAPLCRDISESDISCFYSMGAVSKQANLLAHCIGDLTIAPPSKPLRGYKGSEAAQSAYQVLYQQDLNSLEGISENRQERRARYNQRTLQPILWAAFLLGALILSGMSYFVSGQRARGKLVRTCALFGMVGMMTAIGLVFDRPFAGTTQISGSGWSRLIKHFDHDLANEPIQAGYFAKYCPRD